MSEFVKAILDVISLSTVIGWFDVTRGNLVVIHGLIELSSVSHASLQGSVLFENAGLCIGAYRSPFVCVCSSDFRVANAYR